MHGQQKVSKLSIESIIASLSFIVSLLLVSFLSGILESYWGEHIHLGYYNDEERARGYKKKNFIQAKYDFIDEMMTFGKVGAPKTILDVGCGIGGQYFPLFPLFPCGCL